jgi:hypothetical protein
MKRAILIVSALVAVSSAVWAAEVGFIEDFSLATDREAALKQLIPGTEDYYYYVCLNHQNQGRLDQADETLKAWIARYNRTPRVLEMENRQALLRYAVQPRPSLDFIIRQLGLPFNHQKDEQAAQQAGLPTRLDANLISLETLTQRALEHATQTTAGFELRGLDRLVASNPKDDVRRSLLSRLTRPDYANLPQLIADDLVYGNSAPFGSMPIHQQLLQPQLEELLKLRPAWLNHESFVAAYLMKLQPNPDVDYARDLKARQEHLERLWDFVSRLAPVHNSLKAHVLYQRLWLDRATGVWDHDRFMAYVKLPRQCAYINEKYLEARERREAMADLGRSYPTSMLPPVGSDEALVRSYLAHFMLDAKDYAEFTPYIREAYLREVFAETKITCGVGDAETWTATVSPDFYQALKERVDLDFDFARKEYLGPDEPVALDVYVKNVTDLIVKVYEINTLNYYRLNGRPVDLNMDLDGLVANEEQKVKYADPPLRRVKRHFDLKSLSKRGVYIVEFIGNGKSSRALVQKGQLRPLARTGAAGQVFTILDEAGKRVTDARLWLAGHEFTPDKEGRILVPFTHSPVLQTVVISQGDFASLASFPHEQEQYQLAAGFFVDRESLLRRQKATLIIRPALRINGRPADLASLENVVLVITATDRENTSTSKEVRDLKLLNDRETTYELQVPDNLKAVSFMLKGQVQNLSQSHKDDVADSTSVVLNGIDETDKVEDLHLLRTAAGYVVEALGKTGEPKADRAVQFELKHEDFTETVHVSLRSDAAGRIVLGELRGIDWVRAANPQCTGRQWFMTDDRCAYQTLIHGKAGEAVYVPYMGKADKVSPAAFSLLERRGDTFVADRLAAMKLESGILVIEDLPRGDYDLLIKDSQTHLLIRLAEGEKSEGYVLSDHRQLQLKNRLPLQIASVEADADNLRVQLVNAGPDARVHVTAERYVPPTSSFLLYEKLGLARLMTPPTADLLAAPQTQYSIGRNIGDEYRYILERQYARKFPGNMLTRPTLILNPWSPTKTLTGLAVIGVGGRGSQVGGFEGLGNGSAFSGHGSEEAGVGLGSPNLDFLKEPAVVKANLKADDKGLVTISRKDLGAHHLLQVLAVDGQSAAYRQLALDEAKMPFLDLRLDKEAMDPTKHLSQQKQIAVLDKGQALVVRDIGSASVEPYDNLGQAYRLLATLSHNATLQEFGFILSWPKLKAEEKRAKYSEYACHELNFFLYKKDPEFFEKTVLPYLKNKKDKTFLDHFLLGNDLSAYAKPWAYEQLNVAERILLAQRLEGEAARTARHVGDLYDLIPPNVAEFNTLFHTALLGSGLDTGGAIGPNGLLARRDGGKLLKGGRGATALEATLDNYEDADRFAMVSEKAAPMAEPPAAPAPPATARVKAPAPRPTSAPKADRSEDKAKEYDEAAKDMGGDRASRTSLRQLYRPMSQTEEWAENNYYHLPIANQNAGLVTVNAFWRDYAAHDPKKPFVSGNFIYAHHNLTEMMLTLALLDLPFEPAKHETAVKDAAFTLTAGGPVIVFDREIREAQPAAQKTPILVSQNFFRADDRYRFDGNERFDKFVTEEFLIGTVYGSQVVVTNPTSSPQKLEVLLQVPRGAMPAANGLYTRTVSADLRPFSTQTFEYYFYFPLPGKFAQYPVQVAKNGQLIGFAEPTTLTAVTKLSKIDTTSWDYVAQNGAEDEVVRYLKENNINRLDLDRIAWRMRDKAFFQQVVGLLAARHVYQNTLWSYALKHDDPAAAREFLQHQDGFVAQCGPTIDSPLLVIDPVIRKSYQHLEYSPLVNARAHKLGKDHTILNDRLAAQYHSLMSVLAYRKALDDDDLMTVTYYLLLQDRVEESLAFFKRVNPEKLATRLQYDYFTAYTAFYTEDLKVARAQANKYAAYPVDRWRKLFANVSAQLDEIEGKPAAVVDEKDRAQAQAGLAATEASFDVTLEGKTVTVAYRNLSELRVNYYPMNVELLFSRNPFVQQVTGQFAFVKPKESAGVALKEKSGSYKFDLPQAYQSGNVMIEVVAGGVRKTQAYYANSMRVQVIENYGQLKVTDLKDKPLSKVYVKVYARSGNGAAKFYKDGYTDLRGQFDYTSVNTDDAGGVEKFSILILSETEGAVVREANPPKR